MTDSSARIVAQKKIDAALKRLFGLPVEDIQAPSNTILSSGPPDFLSVEIHADAKSLDAKITALHQLRLAVLKSHTQLSNAMHEYPDEMVKIDTNQPRPRAGTGLTVGDAMALSGMTGACNFAALSVAVALDKRIGVLKTERKMMEDARAGKGTGNLPNLRARITADLLYDYYVKVTGREPTVASKSEKLKLTKEFRRALADVLAATCPGAGVRRVTDLLEEKRLQ